ncbi:MAG: hypothetical protein KME30_27990 [Iphinoe sp. HA4291-MV1]|nr:hypothetical protein [Iphinoe sp. HA4291-MV1]
MRHQKLSQTKNAITSPQTKSVIAGSSTHPIEELQGAIGNRAVNRLLANQPIVQAKSMFRGLSEELTLNLQQQGEILPPPEAGGKTIPKAVQQKMG